MRSPQDLPSDIRNALLTKHDLITSADCRALGVSHDRVERLVRNEMLAVLARGVYADGPASAALPPWPRFAVRSRAFVLASPIGAVAADWSAVAPHRLPVGWPPPAVPSVIRQGSRASGSNRTCHGRTRFAAVADRWIACVDDTRAVLPAIAAVDLFRNCDPLTALILADAVARLDKSNDLLVRAWQDMRRWPGINRARWAIEHCDPDAQTPLESAGRLAFIRAGLPVPASNVWVGENGPRFRLDHYWAEERLAAEGDGISKYLIDSDPSRALQQEKDREWWLHSKGIRVIRYTWKLAVGSPHALADRCRILLTEPKLPTSGELRFWTAQEGAEILGLQR